MDDQILFEIAKYVESSSCTGGRLHQALESKEARCQRFLTSRRMVERKMSVREDLGCLRDKNIYRDEDSRINFQKIHHRLERVIGPLLPHKYTYSAAKISPRIASLAKNLDFELRKRLLQGAFWGINPVQYNPCGSHTHRMWANHMLERGEEHVALQTQQQIPGCYRKRRGPAR